MYPKIIKKYIFYIPIRTIHTYIHLYTALNCYHMKSICSLIHAKLQYITFPSLPQKELRHIKQIYGWTFLMQMHTKQKNRKCTHSYQQRDSLFYDSGTAFFFPSKVITATYCIILWRKVSHAYSLTCVTVIAATAAVLYYFRIKTVMDVSYTIPSSLHHLTL